MQRKAQAMIVVSKFVQGIVSASALGAYHLCTYSNSVETERSHRSQVEQLNARIYEHQIKGLEYQKKELEHQAKEVVYQKKELEHQAKEVVYQTKIKELEHSLSKKWF